MTTKIHGELEIDHERGVVYFHSEKGYTALRIQGIPTPIPSKEQHYTQPMLDINVKRPDFWYCN